MERGYAKREREDAKRDSRPRCVVNETQLHAKGSSLGHCPTKVTSGLDMVIPHSSTDTFARLFARILVSRQLSLSFSLALSLFLSRSLVLFLIFSPACPVRRRRVARLRVCPRAIILKTHHYISASGRYLINNVPLITVFRR